MKAMRAMKAKRVSVVASGKNSRSVVFAGRKEKTATGMTKAKLMKNKAGKIVSKARSALAKKNFASSRLFAWNVALKKARKELGAKGFVAINGKSALGKALYAK